MNKRLIFLLFLALVIVQVKGQDEPNYPIVTLGVNAGFGYNYNAYKFDSNSKGNTFSAGSNPYSIGIDVGIQANKWIRPRIELRYVKMNYKVSWGTTPLSAVYKESNVNLYNFDINLRNDFLLLGFKNFQLFVSPALKWESNVQNECKNTKVDGSYNYKLYSGFDVDNQYPKSTLGFGASILLKYNITSKLGVTLAPEYTYFFNKFVEANSKVYSRFGVNFGFEFKL